MAKDCKPFRGQFVAQYGVHVSCFMSTEMQKGDDRINRVEGRQKNLRPRRILISANIYYPQPAGRNRGWRWKVMVERKDDGLEVETNGGEEVDGGVEVDKDGGLEVGAYGCCLRTRVSAIWVVIMYVYGLLQRFRFGSCLMVVRHNAWWRFCPDYWRRDLGFHGFGGGAFRSAATVTTSFSTMLNPEMAKLLLDKGNFL
ncbi:hypothetical protein V8G54_026822 [Vigna mungo]|uniref:Uncharacterized protein n=1 Tax=Vigna mungo TaxID=3915 RepID=A0AAQ3RPU5_VIGMU